MAELLARIPNSEVTCALGLIVGIVLKYTLGRSLVDYSTSVAVPSLNLLLDGTEIPLIVTG